MGKHFTKAERNELSILLKKGYSRRQIADALRKNHSSITREINRNKVKGVYEPSKADTKSRVRRRSSKYQNMKVNGSPEFINFFNRTIKDRLDTGTNRGTMELQRSEWQTFFL